ncbi:MAG: hypothetical protein K6C36_09585 [Clostridia bacterium]|nr:hypothetical protein [Clostridia bacterium]
MPLITTKSNVVFTKEDEQKLAELYGKAIGLIGKSDKWLMLEFSKPEAMYFQGREVPCAIAEVSLFGKARSEQYEELTGALTQAISEVSGIPGDRIYISYSELGTWGWAGHNF